MSTTTRPACRSTRSRHPDRDRPLLLATRDEYNRGMTEPLDQQLLRVRDCPALDDATLVLAFTGWMDGGDVSTGTVRRLVDLLGARPVADIDPDPFYLFHFPGSMEIAALFRPAIRIKDGLIESLEMPRNVFYCHEPANLVLFLGREPNLMWR